MVSDDEHDVESTTPLSGTRVRLGREQVPAVLLVILGSVVVVDGVLLYRADRNAHFGGAFEISIGALMVVISLSVLVRSLLRPTTLTVLAEPEPEPEPGSEPEPKGSDWSVAWAIALIVVQVALIPLLGFAIATAVGSAAMSKLLFRASWFIALALGVAWLAFMIVASRYLGVNVPAGPWGI